MAGAGHPALHGLPPGDQYGGTAASNGYPLDSDVYTFTDTELQSLLVSLDQGTGCQLTESMMGGSAGSTHQSLQFLPHLPSSHGSPEHAPAVFVPADLTGLSGLQPLDVPPHLTLPLALPAGQSGPGAQQPAAAYQQQQQQQQLGMQRQPSIKLQVGPRQAVRGQGQQRPARATAAAAAAAHAAAAAREAAANAAKQPHSQVEKQRRDRINNLIDELRELVPPQAADQPAAAVAAEVSGAGGDCRRPKHVVLSDTIRLIKDLQLQVAEQQQMDLDGLHAVHAELHAVHAVHALSQHTQPHSPPLLDSPPHRLQYQAEDSGTANGTAMVLPEGAHSPMVQRRSTECGHPELPLAPDDDAVSVCGVVVEEAEGCSRYVKVTCADRQGLLADVVRALKELPLEITTAAITTRRDRIVYDVFQVELEDPSLPHHTITTAVEAALRLPGPGDKKRRQSSPAMSP